jgi:hypothetical protein
VSKYDVSFSGSSKQDYDDLYDEKEDDSLSLLKRHSQLNWDNDDSEKKPAKPEELSTID